MRTLTTLCFVVLAQATATAESPIQRQFIGSWKLISYELTSTKGEVTYPRGRDAIGRIIYDELGRMSVQIMQPGRPNFEGVDPLKATPEEMITACRGYFAYYGTYAVDESRSVVIHKVEGSLYPNYIGTDHVRHYSFSSNRLTLEAETQVGRAKLVWERLP